MGGGKFFSHREGYKSVREEIQIEALDEKTKTRLWNEWHRTYWADYVFNSYPTGWGPEEMSTYLQILWNEYFHEPIDTIHSNWENNYKRIRKEVLNNSNWYEVYDFLEFTAKKFPNEQKNQQFIDRCNRVLEEEMAAYRFVNNKIVQISSEQEIDEIEEAMKRTQPLGDIQDHLEKALELLSDRDSPDHRNSIKESISAVEALCKLITGDNNATLGSALKILNRGDDIELHPALKEGFSKIYGYASDEEGIRHAMLKKPNLGTEDSKFMLIASSAFINYLITKSEKSSIDLSAELKP